MGVVLRINSVGSAQTAINTLKRVGKNMPEMPPKVMMRWGKILERDMKSAARAAGIKPFTGTLYEKGIEYRQRPRGKVGMLFIRQYGVMLDSMKTHLVSVNRRRSRLLAWAEQAQKGSISSRARLVKGGKLKKFPIVVRAHPFIRAGWGRARRKLRPMLVQYTEQTLKGG